MHRLLLSATAALVVTAPVQADAIRDVLLLPGEAHVWIALEGAPSGLMVETSGGRMILNLSGFQPEAREIRPRSGPIEMISVRSGGQLLLSGATSFADAELRQGGILVNVSGATQYAGDVDATPGNFIISAPIEATDGDVRADEVIQTASAADAAPAAAPIEATSRTIRTTSRDVLQTEPAEPTVNTAAAPAQLTTDPNENLPAGPCDATAAQIASSPWDLDGLAAHAACMADIGEVDNAAGLYERVLAFEPSHFQAALGLARLREVQGRREDAARLFETASRSALTDGQALAARQSAQRLRGDGD